MNLAKKSLATSFTTKRLIVRCHEKNDMEPLYEAARESIKQVYPFLPWCHPNYKKNDSKIWLEHSASQWASNNAYNFAIYDKLSGRFIGGCGLNRIDDHPVANLGYWIRSSEMNKGYATEAAIGLIEYGFRNLSFFRIEIIMSVNNPASKLVAEKSGGIFEGILKNRLSLHNTLHDAFLYAVTP